MDSSDSKNSTSSNGKNENEDSTMGDSQSARFFETYQRQCFSLPDSIMFYVAKNPTTAEMYQKMIRTCKDFFVKNPILVISNFVYGEKWGDFLDNLKSKIWITSGFHVQPNDSINNKAVSQNITSYISPKLYRCDSEHIALYNQVISFDDLSRVISTAKFIYLKNVVVKDNDGSIEGIEKIVAVAVKAKWLKIYSPPITSITSKTMKELIEIPNFSKLDRFYMNQIPETFDIEAFYVYMKKNRLTRFVLDFKTSISDEYKNCLEEITDEIIALKVYTYKPPYILFHGFSGEKKTKLHRIWIYKRSFL